MTLADEIERRLAEARDAMAALDRDAVEKALGAAQATLEAHPELPNAAWLLAEVLRVWSARWLRIEPKDEARAAEAWAAADALDGGRMAGVVELRPKTEEHAAGATLVVANDEGATAWLDGVPVTPGAVTRLPGRHQVVTTRGGDTTSASWMTFTPGAELRVDAGGPAPCSKGDLARAAASPAKDAVSAAAVACPAWVAAVATSDPRAIRVARCEASRCGPLFGWREGAPPAWVVGPSVPAPRVERGGFVWPAWATWVSIGAGACVLAASALVLSGAFASRPTETHFVSGGVKVQGFALPLLP